MFSNFENTCFADKIESKNLVANEFFNIKLDGKSIKQFPFGQLYDINSKNRVVTDS